MSHVLLNPPLLLFPWGVFILSADPAQLVTPNAATSVSLRLGLQAGDPIRLDGCGGGSKIRPFQSVEMLFLKSEQSKPGEKEG